MSQKHTSPELDLEVQRIAMTSWKWLNKFAFRGSPISFHAACRATCLPSAQDNSIAKSLPAFFPQQYMPLTIEVSSLRIRICRTNRVIRIRREQLLVVCIVQPHRVCLCVWWAAWLERMRFFRTCSKPAFWTGSWHGAVSPSCLGHLSQL